MKSLARNFTLAVSVTLSMAACLAAADVPPKPQFIKGWGKAIDPKGDCQIKADGDQVVFSVNGAHDLSVELSTPLDAPRVLQDIQGDFIAQVKVSGVLRPRAPSTIPTRRPYTGAGLLLWLDEKNYVRLERAAMEADGQVYDYLSFEQRKDGQLDMGQPQQLGLQADAVVIRLERRGGKLYGLASYDRQQWVGYPPLEVKLPEKLQLGVAAVSSSGAPFTPRFSEFEVYHRKSPMPPESDKPTKPTSDKANVPSIHIAQDAAGKCRIELMIESSSDGVKRDDWSRRFIVDVVTTDETADAPSMLGSYQAIAGGVRFTPRYPLQPGLRYRAEYRAADGTTVSKEFQSSDRPPAAATGVAAVYPTATMLPENQLKFYLHFTAAMGRGEAYDHLHLLDEAGNELDLPFLEVGEELWDPSGTRLTLLLDPARVKRGLKPREEQGPVLEAGRRYTLVIDRRWRDAAGRPLRAEFRKRFSVGPPDETCPEPRRWQLAVPAAGSRTPLAVRLGESLDQALLERMLSVTDSAGRRVPGEVQIGEREATWSFTPEQAWQAGKYRLVADTLLEDLAGNSIARKFEVEASGPARTAAEPERTTIDFTVTTADK